MHALDNLIMMFFINIKVSFNGVGIVMTRSFYELLLFYTIFGQSLHTHINYETRINFKLHIHLSTPL